MRPTFSEYFQKSWDNYREAVTNLMLFFPYFFSIKTLSKTLFQPWKNIKSYKTEKGFSFNAWFDRFAFDAISRGMGFFMRSSIILFYFLLQMFFIIFLPLITLIYFLYIPLNYLFTSSAPTDEQKKASAKAQFISAHLINPLNQAAVEEWFENIYAREYHTQQWWKLQNLMNTPPLARDWSVGYTPTLDEYALDLAATDYQQNLGHIVAREKEVQEIEQILSKSELANVIIVGEEGVGKHTIIDAFAKKVYEGKTNPLLMYRRILKLDMEKIMSQFTESSQREEFLKALLQEAAAARNVILFIDNIQKYVSSDEHFVDLSGPIEEYARTVHLQVIGTTTPFLFQKYITQNEKINQVFTKVDVYEINLAEAKMILLDTVQTFEQRYKVSIPYETIDTVITKSDFFITAIPFPEKAIQLLDSACVYTLQTLQQKIVRPEVIDTVLTQRTHIPTFLSEELKQKLLQMEQILNAKIVDQAAAVTEVASTLRRSFLLIGKRRKPLAAFLFLGPTGVGKTETAKAINEVFFNSRESMLRFDMSAFQLQENIPQLIGSIETGNPGLLTKAIRERPYGVLLLDELEKADKDLLNIFLTILDEGYFTDGFGKRVDCKNLIIIATSNAGAEILYKQNQQPASNTQGQQTMMNILIENHIFSPEFLNRFDGVITFNQLHQAGAATIARTALDSVIKTIYDIYKVEVEVSDATLQQLVQKSYNPSFGARDMQRILRKEIEDKVATLILSNQAVAGQKITL